MNDATRWDDFWRARIAEFESVLLTSFGRRFMEILLPSIPEGARHFLEVGSGRGHYSLSLARRWPDREFVGLDVAGPAIRESSLNARRHGIDNAAFLCADARCLPFEDNSFDVVFSEGVLCYMKEDRQALGEMVRVARVGGRLIVAVPNLQNILFPVYKCLKGSGFQYGSERSYAPRRLRRWAGECGLSNIKIRGFYAAYTIVRLGGTLKRIGEFLDRVVVRRLDRVTGDRFSDAFGFYITLIGQKSNAHSERFRRSLRC